MNNNNIPWTATSESFDKVWAEDGEFDPFAQKTPDTLVTIFEQQRHLMQRVWSKELDSGLSIMTREHEWGDLDNRRVQGRIHETFGHLIRELSEAMAHLDGSKSWKDKPRPTDVHAFREEIADSLHFFVELCILAGISAEDLFLSYFLKAATNTDRIQNGY